VHTTYDATYPGYVTGSEDGRAVAPLMGDFSDYDGGYSYVDVGPAGFFLAYPDHGVMYLFVPRGPQRTDMELSWLVRGDAVEGRVYDRERLVWLWRVTSEADLRIIEKNQEGVNSRYYRPGPYGPMERQPRRFGAWYLAQIA
jgi:Rieske 2Fe-2S family protein